MHNGAKEGDPLGFHGPLVVQFNPWNAHSSLFDRIDCTNSFGTLQRWVSELQEKGPRDLRIMVAGNKKDLEGDRQVAAEEAEAYAESIGARYMETSAKDDMAVQDLFLSLCQQVPLVSPAGGSAIRAGIYLSGPQAEGKAKQGSRTCC